MQMQKLQIFALKWRPLQSVARGGRPPAPLAITATD